MSREGTESYFAPGRGAEPCRGVASRARATSEEGAVTVSAYILIQTEVGKASSVVEAVRNLPGVVQADDVTGPYDVILRAEAASIDELGKMVVSQVQLVDGITRTLTCPVVHL
ncbi:MAG: Lrp/AsnC ligand binding domain-containing protein [Candidatus Rokubacteria bacterium]|nr:Lrp/AsnC ligand binding domain-containing protein [Candidatus Rokubacteria bacterium]